jgi:hypothetical protein
VVGSTVARADNASKRRQEADVAVSYFDQLDKANLTKYRLTRRRVGAPGPKGEVPELCLGTRIRHATWTDLTGVSMPSATRLPNVESVGRKPRHLLASEGGLALQRVPGWA